jgi:hypothetical protein
LGYLIGVILLTHPLNTTDLPTIQRKILQLFKLKEEHWKPRKRVKRISHTRDIIKWATDIDIITEHQHRWTWKGKVLDAITPEKQKDAFLSKKTHVPDLLNGKNFTEEQKLFFLYIMIESDGHFLLPFANRIIKEDEFRVSSNKDLLENDFRKIYYNSWMDLVNALKESSLYSLRKEGRTLEKMVKQLKPRTLYIKALSKLEPLVDLSFLRRASDQLAHYTPVKDKLAFFDTFPELENFIQKGRLENFLRDEFFQKWSKTIGNKENVIEVNRMRLLEKHIAKSYSELISPRWQIINRNEVALLTCLKSFFSEPNLIVEFNEALQYHLKLTEKYGPKEVQLFGDYEGKLSSIKIGNDALNKMLDANA